MGILSQPVGKAAGARGSLMMYLQLIADFKTKSKLAYYGMAIILQIGFANASWVVIIGDSAVAQISSPDVLVRDSVDQTQLLASTNQELDRQESKDRRTIYPQIAQVIVPVPTEVPPIIIPSLLPQFTQIVPLNSVLTPELLIAPNNTPAVPSVNTPIPPQSGAAIDPRFIIAPKVLDPQLVDPFSTQFVLNGNKVSHFTTTVVTTGYESGNFRTSDLNFDIYKLIGAKHVQSVTADRVVRVNSQTEVGGVRTVAQNQDTTVSIFQPQTLLGFRQQISLDASCLDGSGQTCTYLPGIKIDDSVIDRNKLQPTGAKITSQFGDVISPASIAAIREPGFQGGANGENYGIDLYLPAVGLVSPPPGTPTVLTGERKETINTGIAVNYTRMNQDFATNGKESTLGRTIRSLNYINGDRNQLLNLAVNGIGQILPGVQPSIAPGEPGARIVVNPNLYRAANAVRIPDNSLTVYQVGTGYAISRGADPKVPPGANHQALWVGLSPVVEREFIKDYRYITLGERIVNSGGGEGGSVPVSVNLNNFGFNAGGLQNPYAQGYVTVYNRDVQRVDIETIRQRTDYYPHISYTGTNLNENSLWRYFTGAIVNAGFEPKTTQNIKAYIGTDYSIVNPRGLSYSLGGIGYLNADPEYSSQLFANANQSIPIGANPGHNLVIGVNANYIADGSIKIQSLPVRSAQSFISAGLGLNLGNVSIGGTQFFGNLLPESIENKTILNAGWKVTDRLKLGAFVSLFDRNVSTNPLGASLSYDLDPNANSTLYLGWNSAEIDFRRSLGSTANIYKDNTVSVSLRYGF
jgi:hypothetical protein